MISAPVAMAVPLTLAESIAMALERNEAINIGENDVDRAKWMLKYYRRVKGPRLTWSSSAARIGGRDYEGYNRQHNLYGDKVSPAYNNEFSNAFQLQVPLYDLNAERQIKSGRYNLNAADMTLENTKQTLRFQVIKSYYDVLMRQNQIKVAQSAIEMSSDRLRMIREQYEEGTVAKSDLLTMEVELGDYRQQLNSAENERKTATETLNNLVGLPEGTGIEPQDELKYDAFELDPQECLEYALRHRPDRAAALYNKQKAEADLAAVSAANDPTLTGALSQIYSGNGAFQQNHKENWSIGVNLNWTLFDNAQNSARVHSAEADLASAKERLSQIERQIGTEVANAYSQMATAEENLKITEQSVKQAEENNAIAQVRYEEGVDTIINLTNAQEKLTRARTNYFNALYNYNIGKATLLKALGVPVNIDAAKYVTAEQEGKSSPEASEIATTDENFPLPKEPTEEAATPKEATSETTTAANTTGESVAEEMAI